MYKELTKVVEVDGKQCVACIKFNTSECLIHNGGCASCKMFAAILNQLHAYEEILKCCNNMR